MRETVAFHESDPASQSIVKTRVYFLRIHVIAPRYCFLANLEDPRLLRLPKVRLFRLKIRFLKTIGGVSFFLIIINPKYYLTHKPLFHLGC